ncbi:putative glutathione-S-transferase theta, GST [Talaromyces proteolyticus]|uniref:Glutathione-S-transferase theta, GST n=1 Tax=Talaromyces proteolyticus TaxID=1131652 RepID=A0AAD4KS25_9EURO|nr:putative glutathione-S-transferase theta, GST [Talaromyces proteolyticus]KAH8695282.1 putative glutathione-S-transferase theta, GST [Talaromyces proteolyticus]
MAEVYNRERNGDSNKPPKIKLYYTPGSCSFAPHILLFEAGLNFEPILVERRNSSKTILSINPKGRVPVLVLDNEHVITEVPAILTAIALHVPERKLLGLTILETVRVYEWLNWLSGTLHGQAFAGWWRADRFIEDPTDEDKEKLKRKAYKTIQGCYEMIEAKLSKSKSPFSVGSSMTVVDAFLAVFYRWGCGLGFKMSVYEKYTELWNALLERQSVIQALKYQD